MMMTEEKPTLGVMLGHGVFESKINTIRQSKGVNSLLLIENLIAILTQDETNRDSRIAIRNYVERMVSKC